MINSYQTVAISCLLAATTFGCLLVHTAPISTNGAQQQQQQADNLKPASANHHDVVSSSPTQSAAAAAAVVAQSSSSDALSAPVLHQHHQATADIQRVERATSGLPHHHELETQATHFSHHLPAVAAPSYSAGSPSQTESDYGYDSGKNSYGKQASDWSLYDQGNHGLYDKYGDKAWKDQGHQDQASHGKHDSYGNSYNSHGSGHGSGYYSRDRGYGYEKHYAYDKEVASKHHADNHNNYGSQHGLHDHYGNTASNSHTNLGHDKYGQASRYGNHGYGKRGSNLAANHDYGHNLNKGHYYSHSSPPQSYHHSYASHVPTYRSTYSDYSPQVGYPSGYPSYY